MGKVLIIGSSNTDMVVRANKFPLPGETVVGKDFFLNQGGKGANQAVAAARLGADVTFITKVGSDIFGSQSIQSIINEDINADYVIIDNVNPTGVALITVDSTGENSIVVAPGANMSLLPSELAPLDRLFAENEILLIQLEIPLPTVEYCINKASALSIKVILNPAPGNKISDTILQNLFLITPNETETEIITGVKITSEETIREAAIVFRKKGVKNVIITLGSKGVYLLNNDISQFISSPKVTVVDTTAAGDVFNGALATSIAEGLGWIEAINFACKAAAISVTRLGAQASAPYRKEI